MTARQNAYRMLALAALWLGPGARAAELEVGIATAEITPPRGYRMAGYYSERTNTGTKDPLLAKAIVLRQGDQQAALVFCDLVGIPRDVSARARSQAEADTGIPARNIAICATHSHTGPLYFGVLRSHFHNRAVKEKGRDPSEEINYAAGLVGRLADAIASAHDDLAPARIAAGFADQQGLSFNRRFHMKDGSVVFNPGARNPNIVRAAGPIDPQVGLLAVYGPRQAPPRAALTVFALHLDTVGGTEYSADYPHHLEAALRRQLGAGFVSLFGAGTCGDINHIDVTAERRLTAEAIGSTLAATVSRALPTLRQVDRPSLAVTSLVVKVPAQQYGAAEVAEARTKVSQVGGPKPLPFLDAVRAVKIVDLQDNYPDREISLEVQAFRLGPEAAVVTLPGEVFVELGLQIKRSSPFRTTIVIELANSTPAYVPTRKAFAEGSYEVVNSRVASGGGEALSAAAIQLLKELAQ